MMASMSSVGAMRAPGAAPKGKGQPPHSSSSSSSSNSGAQQHTSAAGGAGANASTSAAAGAGGVRTADPKRSRLHAPPPLPSPGPTGTGASGEGAEDGAPPVRSFSADASAAAPVSSAQRSERQAAREQRQARESRNKDRSWDKYLAEMAYAVRGLHGFISALRNGYREDDQLLPIFSPHRSGAAHAGRAPGQHHQQQQSGHHYSTSVANCFINIVPLREVERERRELELIVGRVSADMALESGQLHRLLLAERRFDGIDVILEDHAHAPAPATASSSSSASGEGGARRTVPQGWTCLCGRAGSDLGTATQLVAHRWGHHDKLWHDRFDFVFRVNLSLTHLEGVWEGLEDDSEIGSLAWMILKSQQGAAKPDITFDRIKQVLRDYPNLVLVLLDGFDDISLRYQEEEGPAAAVRTRSRSRSISRPLPSSSSSASLESLATSLAAVAALNGNDVPETAHSSGGGSSSTITTAAAGNISVGGAVGNRTRSVSAGSDSGLMVAHFSRVVAVVDAAMALPNGIVTCRTDAIPKTWIGTGKLRSIYEVVGFTESNVCDYIKEVFRGWGHPALGARLLEEVRGNPELMQLAQIPVNLAALCLITVDEVSARAAFVPSSGGDGSDVSQRFSSQFMGKTLSTTCLYHRLILGLARWYVMERKMSAESRQLLPYLEDEELLEVCAAEFHLLGEVAMDALLSDELQALSPALLRRHFRSAAELRTVVGYMGIVRRMGGTGGSSNPSYREKYATHYFIHPTYREYFTAFRMAQILSSAQSDDEATERKRRLDIQTVTKFVMENHPRSHMIRIFLAGLLCTPKFQAGIELFWDACIDISSALSHASTFGFHAHTNILTSHQRVLREALLTYQAFYEAAGPGATFPLPPRLRAYERRFHQIAQWMEAFQTKCIVPDVDYVSRSRSLIGAQAQHEAMKKQHEYDRKMFGLSPAPALELHILLSPLASWQATFDSTRKRAEDAEIDVRISVAEAIGHCTLRDPESISTLLALLRDASWEVRRAAAKATGKVRSSSDAVVSQLRGMLGDNYAVRIAAAEALGSCGVGDATSLSALLGALEDADWYVRTAAAEALGHMGCVNDKNVVMKLRGLLTDSSEYVRKAAVASIQSLKICDDETIRLLRKLLKDSQKRVQIQAAETLEALKKGDSATAALTSSSHFNIINKLTKVGLKDVNALPQLRNLALRDPDKGMRSAAAEALARVGSRDPGTLYALRMELRSKDYHVRVAACETMGRIGACDPASLRALREALRDRKWEVYLAAAQTLKHLAAHLDAATVSEILELCSSGFEWESKRLELNSELHITLLFTPPLVYAATFSLFPQWLTSQDALLCFVTSVWLHCTSTTVLPETAQLVVDGKDVTLGGSAEELRLFVDNLRIAEGRFLKNLGNYSADMKFIAAGLRQPIELPRTANPKMGRLMV